MPQIYEITAPNGKTLEITGDRMPTEAELTDIFAKAGVATAAGGPTPRAEPGWPARYPKTAQLARGVLDAMPAIGGIVGGAVATPGSLGLATVPGVALGAGVGKGARDLIGHYSGLDAPSSPVDKAAGIARDTAITGATTAVLPGALQAGGAALRLVKGSNGAAARAVKVAQVLARNPSIARDLATDPDFVSMASPRLGASMKVAQKFREMAAKVETAALKGQTGPDQVVDEFTAARTAKHATSGKVDQKALNEAALAARRATYQARQPTTAAATPKIALSAPETKEFLRLLKRGMKGPEAMQAVQQARELAARLGGATPAEVAKAVAQRETTGRW